MYSIFFSAGWDVSSDELFEDIIRQTPDENGVWNSIQGVTDPMEADYQVAFNGSDTGLDLDRTLLYTREPPVSSLYDCWDDAALRNFTLDTHHMPQRWWIDKSYTELKSLVPNTKSKELSWITTDKGRDAGTIERTLRRFARLAGVKEECRRNIPFLGRRATDGHVFRMAFLKTLVERYPDLLDLYGRGDFSGPHYQGTLPGSSAGTSNKWDGLAPYRYSIVIENYSGPNYFSEKIADAYLAWCMPIYWGCTNLSEYFPDDSFVWIDITADDAPERVKKVVKSDHRERNMDAIAEARRRLLDEYQIWPTIEADIAELEGD